MPQIRIDDEVYAWLQGQAKPFDDTPNSVLRRLAGLDDGKPAEARMIRTHSKAPERGQQTPQKAYRAPVLAVLAKHGGQASRMTVLGEVEKLLGEQLTPYDKADIKSGTIRWQKSAEWEVRVMRKEGLLKPVAQAPWGHWALTEKGQAAAKSN